MRIFKFSSGSMVEDASPCSALGGGGAGGGNADEVLSATGFLVMLVEVVWWFEERHEDEGWVDSSASALLWAVGLVKGIAGRLSSAPKGLSEACALWAKDRIRFNKLGSSEDSTI